MLTRIHQDCLWIVCNALSVKERLVLLQCSRALKRSVEHPRAWQQVELRKPMAENACLPFDRWTGLRKFVAEAPSLNIVHTLRPTRHSLEHLKLSCGRTEMMPLLSMFTNLRHLHLEHVMSKTYQAYVSLQFVTSLTRLETLKISYYCPTSCDLQPITGLTHLRELWLYSIQTPSLDPLSSLVQLRRLRLHVPGVTNLRVLENLQNLQTLKLYHCSSLTDIDFITRLTELRQVTLGEANLKHLQPMGVLSKLTHLTLDQVSCPDISALHNISTLSMLRLRGGKMSLEMLRGYQGILHLDVSFCSSHYYFTAIAGFTQLRSLNLSYTRIEDLTPLFNLTELEKLELCCTKVKDLSPLRNLRNLQILHLGNTSIEDLSPLRFLIRLITLRISCSPVVDLTPLAHMPALTKLECCSSEVNNLTPLITIPKLSELNIYNTPRLKFKHIKRFIHARPDVTVNYEV